MNQRLRRDERQAATRARLLDAAAELFARRGFQGTSVEQVAEHAGFSKGAVYSNFATKRELLATLLAERCQAGLLAVAGAAQEGGPVGDRLERVARATTDRVLADRDWTLLYFELWAQAVRTGELRPAMAEVLQHACDGVAALIEAGAARLEVDLPVSPQLLASLCIAVMDGLAMQLHLRPEQVSPEAAGTALRILLAPLISAEQRQPSSEPQRRT